MIPHLTLNWRLWLIRLLCWLAVPLLFFLIMSPLSDAFNLIFRQVSALGGGYAGGYCIAPILILLSPGLIQWLILRRLLPGPHPSFAVWLLMTALAAALSWIGAFFFLLSFMSRTTPATETANLIDQAIGYALVGAGLGFFVGGAQKLLLAQRDSEIAPGWIRLNMSSWAVTPFFFFVLLPFMLRSAPLPVLDDAPVTTICHAAPTPGPTWAAVSDSPSFRFALSESPDQPGLKWLASTPPELHLHEVKSVAFSPDGRTLAVAGDEMILLDVASGVVTMTFPFHPGSVTAVAFSPDGRMIASHYGWDGLTVLYDVTNGAILASLPGQAGLNGPIAFSPDGQTLATGSGSTIILWDMAGRTQQAILTAHAGPVTALSFSPDGQALASGGADAAIIVWNVKQGTVLNTLRGHAGEITSLAFSPGGQMLASSNDNPAERGVRLWAWKVYGGRQINKLLGHRAGAVAFSPTGQVVIGSDDNFILWQPTTGQRARSSDKQIGGIHALAISPDGQTVATAGSPGLVLWEINTGKIRAGYGFYGVPTDIAFSSDGATIASSSRGRSWSNSLKLWQTTVNKLLPLLQCNAGSVETVAFSPDGRMFAAFDRTGLISLRHLANGALQATLEVADPHLATPTPKSQMEAESNAGKSLWSATGEMTLVASPSIATDLAAITASPDGKWVAASDYRNTIFLWDAASGNLSAELQEHDDTVYIHALTFSRDGTLLATADVEGFVKLWSVPEGRLLAALPGHFEGLYLLAFSYDGQFLAGAGGTTAIPIWRVANHSLFTVLNGHTNTVSAIAFGPNSWLLASAGEDNAIRLWTMTTQKEIFQITVESARWAALAFSPDGSKLASLQLNGVIDLWQVIP
jgi:WD40 repeat protein